MNAIPFDTLKMARKLEAAGFSSAQAAGAAEAMADAMAGAELATKADLLAMQADLEHQTGLVRTGLEREIGLVRVEMTAMETRLTTVIAGVRKGLELLSRDLTIRLGAMMIAGFGIMLAAMRYMLMHP